MPFTAQSHRRLATLEGGVWPQSICGSTFLHVTLLTVTPGESGITYLASLNTFYMPLDVSTWHSSCSTWHAGHVLPGSRHVLPGSKHVLNSCRHVLNSNRHVRTSSRHVLTSSINDLTISRQVLPDTAQL